MTDKNFVHGCVQRSERELNPLGVTQFHTLRKLVSYTGCVWDRNRHLPTGRYVKKISLRLRLQVLIFPEPYVLVLLSTQFRLRIQQARSLEKPTLELQITPQFCVSDRLAITHCCDSATTHSSWGQPVYSFLPKQPSSSALSFVTGVDFSSYIYQYYLFGSRETPQKGLLQTTCYTRQFHPF